MKKFDPFLDALKPICYLCQKEVEEISSEIEHHCMIHHVKVKCHGQEESVKIPVELLYNGIFSKGIAFKQKGISHEQ
jgi:hypothetical protein